MGRKGDIAEMRYRLREVTRRPMRMAWADVEYGGASNDTSFRVQGTGGGRESWSVSAVVGTYGEIC